MGDDHLLRLPLDHPLEGEAGLLFVTQEAQAQVEGRLAVRVRHSGQPNQPPVNAAELLGLEVLYQVRQYQGACLAVEEDDLFHESAAAEDELVDVLRPCLLRPIPEVCVEGNVDVLGCGPLAHARRCPSLRLRISPLPGCYVGVVDLIGRDEVPDRSEGVELETQTVIKLGWGPHEQVAAGEADDHSGWERHRTAREGHPNYGTVDHPEVLADRLEGVERLIEFHGQSILAHSPSEMERTTLPRNILGQFI